MTKGKRDLIWRLTAVASVAALIGILVIVIRGGVRSSAQVESHDFGSEMVKYVKQGRFDEAIQVGLRSIQNQPSDEIVYQQIADVYLLRARKDVDQKEQWLSKAVFYTEKSLLLNSKARDAVGAYLLQDALSFETVGDLSATSRCSYYDRARNLLEERIPLLQGDHLVLDGKTFPLAHMREENEKRLTEVQAKRAKAGCK